MVNSSFFDKEESAGMSLVLINKLYRYWILLKRFWWLVLTLVVLSLAWQYYSIQKKPIEYMSTGRMMVRGQLKIPDGVAYNEELSQFFGTQIEIMQSGQVLQASRDRVLRDRPDLEEVSKAALIAKQIPKTHIFQLEAHSIDETYAELFLDAVMHEFMEFKRDKREETSFATISQVTAELSRLKKEQEEQHAALVDFKEKNKYQMSYWEAQGSDGVQYLSELKNQEARLKTRIRFLDSLSFRDRGGSVNDISGLTIDEITTSGILNELPISDALREEYFEVQKQLLKAEVVLQDFMQVLSPEHPKVVAIKEEIRRLENFVELLLFQNLELAKSNISLLKKEQKTVSASIEEWEQNVLESSRIQSDYEILKVKLDMTRNLYSGLLSTLQRLELSGSIDMESVQILEEASSAIQAPRSWIKGLGGGVLIGLCIGFAFIVVMDVLDDRIVSSVDLEGNFKEPLLSQIPDIDDQGAGQLILDADEHRLPFAEAFRNLRSSIIFKQESNPVKTMIVTSSFPGEGKSTIAANLAITMAQTGERILLIDGDLRRGSLSKMFNAPEDRGLTNALDNIHNWKDYITSTDYPNLHIMPLGEQPNQPGELFLRPSLDVFLEEVKKNFDRIIFDSAPLLAVTDSASLAPKLDAVVMVVRSGLTSQDKAKQAIQSLEARQANVFGLVLNGLEALAPGYGYYRYTSYYY